MSYCKVGDTPKVLFYPRDSTQQQQFISPYSPIEVVQETEAISDVGQKYNPLGFTINFSNGQKQTVVNYRYGSQPNTIQYWSCGATDWDNRQPDGSYPVFYSTNEASIVSIDTSVNCPLPPTTNNCALKVRYQGSVIFAVSITCGSKFDVACSGKCPDGYIECKCDAYPGYCCIPCSEIRGGIAAATAALRGINNG